MDEDKYRPPSVGEAPWLIIAHENYNRLDKQTFCTMSPLLSKNNSYVKRIVELDGKSILTSHLGWLILRERQNMTMYSMWNPVTLQYLLLPPLQDAPNEEQQPECVLTSAPNDNNGSNNIVCVLLVFFKGLVFSCRPAARDCKWVKQSIQHDDTSVLIRSAITLNGYIYAYALLDSRDGGGGYCSMFVRMKVIDDDSNSVIFEPSFLELPEKNCLKFNVYPLRLNYMVEASGVLYLVHMMMRQQDDMQNYDFFKAFVWRLDLSRLKWILVESLGDRAFLLGDHGCTWCWASKSRSDALGVHIEGDCIYLAQLGCQTMHSFRLRDNSYTFLLAHSNFLRFFEGPTWFMPYNHPRLSVIEQERIESGEEMEHVEDVNEEMDMEKSRSVVSVLIQLPLDILILIANRMHLFDYMNLRATCKTIRSAIPLAKWKHGCSFPLFMSLKNNKGMCELWDPFQNISHTINTPHSPDSLSTIEFCKDGWLLLRIDEDSLQYFNPFIRKRKEYPPCDMVFNSSYAFSTTPDSSDCLTVGIFGNNLVEISCFQAASEKWDDYFFKYNPDEDIGFQANYNSSPKYYNGAFYFIDVTGNLGVFKLVDGKWIWKVYNSPLTEDARNSLNSCYLVELDGQLTCVFFQQVGKRVQMFKFEILEENWVELDDLGEHVLFLSTASSLSVLEKDMTMRNRIYMPKRVGNGIIYYSLDTRKYHILGGEDSMDDFYGMTSQSFCCWI